MEVLNHFGAKETNYKRVVWSPDGSQILAVNEDTTITSYGLDAAPISLFKAPGTINDICWYPWMRPDIIGSACYLAAIHGQPLKVIDSNTGASRMTYKPINHLDELDGSCVSCAFSPDARVIYTGSTERIYTFDSSSSTQSALIKTRHNRKSRDGQAGGISALCPRWDDTGVLAAGSFSGSVGIYDMRIPEPLTLLLRSNISGGVTQIIFDPASGMDLFVGHRQADQISVWDLRMGDEADWSVPRPSMTNQRIYFSISDGKMYSGTSESPGDLMIIDLNASKSAAPNPFHAVKIHNDIVSSVSCNPSDPSLVATCSGQRHYQSANAYVDNSMKITRLS
jgi:WD40 repeat protein